MRWFRLTVSLAVVGGLTLYFASSAWRAWKYPYGSSHCCSKAIVLGMQSYADMNGGFFPAGEPTPEASLALLAKAGIVGANELRGKTVPQTVTALALANGKFTAADTGWHYVEGLTIADDNRIAVLWDKVGLGHNGERYWDGSREVSFIDGSSEHVSAKDWRQFLINQKQLLARRTEAAKSGKPALKAAILMPNGDQLTEFPGRYIMRYPARTNGLVESSGSPLSADQLFWLRPPVDNGTFEFQLELVDAQLVSEVLKVTFTDGVAQQPQLALKMSPMKPGHGAAPTANEPAEPALKKSE